MTLVTSETRRVALDTTDDRPQSWNVDVENTLAICNDARALANLASCTLHFELHMHSVNVVVLCVMAHVPSILLM